MLFKNLIKYLPFFYLEEDKTVFRNYIGRISNGQGGWIEDEGEKREFITNFFWQLFRSSVQGGCAATSTSCSYPCDSSYE